MKTSRRSFLQLLGAATGAAGLSLPELLAAAPSARPIGTSLLADPELDARRLLSLKVGHRHQPQPRASAFGTYRLTAGRTVQECELELSADLFAGPVPPHFNLLVEDFHLVIYPHQTTTFSSTGERPRLQIQGTWELRRTA